MQVLVPAFAQRIIDSELFAKKASYKAIKACLGSITESRLSNFTTRTGECLALIPDLQLGADEYAATTAISYLHWQLRKMHAELFGSPEAATDDGM